MPGPAPKPASQRRRRNKTPGARTLSAVATPARRPKLPTRRGHPWHEATKAWWADVWASPMAPEFDKSDIHGLYRLAALVDRYWVALDDPRARSGEIVSLSAEIRLVGQPFGLNPLDRRRLQWEIEKGEEAAAKTTERRKPKSVTPSADPRLHAVGD